MRPRSVAWRQLQCLHGDHTAPVGPDHRTRCSARVGRAPGSMQVAGVGVRQPRGAGESGRGGGGAAAAEAKTVAMEAELLAELDTREVPKKALGCGSTADWFTQLAGDRSAFRPEDGRARHDPRPPSGPNPRSAPGRDGVAGAGLAWWSMPSSGSRWPPTSAPQRRGDYLEEAGRLNATDLHRAGASPGVGGRPLPRRTARREAVWTGRIGPPTCAASSPSPRTAAAGPGHGSRDRGGPWEVRLAEDRRPEFLPPTKAGRPPPDWIRHRPRHE